MHVSVLEVIQSSTAFLTKKGIESPRLQVELLLAHALNLPRLQLYLNFERALSGAELGIMRGFLKRRAAHEPLQHIIGSTSFCGLDLLVRPSVLIPRPETELLAERAWQFLNGLSIVARPAALDMGTGSGCVAIALAVKCPAAEIEAVDISAAALEVARENAERHQVLERIHFREANAFSDLPAGVQFDLIVSNPPYIPSSEVDNLQPEVRDYDPRLALNGGDEGLDFYHVLASKAAPFLKPGGRMMLEFGDDQGERICDLLREHNWIVQALDRDYTDRDRILVASAGFHK